MRDRSEYSLLGYGSMIADRVRMRAYHDALKAVIRPGATVVDIGAGTGILSLLACKFGARKVYAVEPSDAILLGPDLAKANGFADRIEFRQTTSLDLQLAERADVIVSDIRGTLPLHRRIVPCIVDARQRLLAPGGALVPAIDTIMAQPVSDDAQFRKHRDPWEDGALDLDLSSALRWISQSWHRADFSGARFAAPPAALIEIDYRTVISPNFRGSSRWTCDHDATVHGFAAWFESELTEGVTLSNAPAAPRAIYGQALFPLPRPIEARAGDVLGLTLAATLVGESYVWQWDTKLERPGTRPVSYAQSSFNAAPVNPRRLRLRTEDFNAPLSAEGLAARFVLERMAQRVPLGEITRALPGEFPELFAASPERARALVAELAEWFTRAD